jgi:hypothetical protein
MLELALLDIPAPAPCHHVMSEAIAAAHADSPISPCNTAIWNRVAGPIPGAVPLVRRRGDLRGALAAHHGPAIISLSLTYDTARCPPTPLMRSWGSVYLRERKDSSEAVYRSTIFVVLQLLRYSPSLILSPHPSSQHMAYRTATNLLYTNHA